MNPVLVSLPSCSAQTYILCVHSLPRLFLLSADPLRGPRRPSEAAPASFTLLVSYLQLPHTSYFLYLQPPGPLPPVSLTPFGPTPPPSGPCPCVHGLQLADEFIRPRALPRSVALFGPNREAIGGPLVAIGHRPRSLEVGQKSPRMSHMSIFALGVHRCNFVN